MNKLFILLGCLYSIPLFSQPSLSGSAYLQHFMMYTQWSEHLPQKPDKHFLAFIHQESFLSKKLREKWLYQLVQNKDWDHFTLHYQASTDLNLQCFHGFALYMQSHHSQALEEAKKIWLSPESQPAGCTQLFKLLQQSPLLTDELISQRIILALDSHHLALASYLLGQYKVPRREAQKRLLLIHQNPSRMTSLKQGPLYDYFYLYALKQLVMINMKQAIHYWKLPQTQKTLSHAQKQAFLAHLALYKAKHDQKDSIHWFSKVEPRYYNDTLLDWQIRFALKRQQWLLVETFIRHLQDQENPCWQYWLARSLEARGKLNEANAIYTPLAATRHYYGFLASLRIKQTPHFQNNEVPPDLTRLIPYHSLMNTIRDLYRSKQIRKASQLLNDFTSDLAKEDKIALLYWLTHDLQWHSKSLALSNNDELSNQLSLRFPLAYQQNIHERAKTYDIPEAFIYAIIRQESEFREDVVSSSGARGLMQLMPNTAKVVAKMAKIPYYNQNQLFLWRQNIALGIAYLNTLAKRFSNHPILMAAAYNAGPKQVVNWLSHYPTTQMDLWIETLPYQETRNYLKNVIAFYTVYEYSMKQKSHLKQIMEAI